LAHNLATPCFGHEPKARVATHSIFGNSIFTYTKVEFEIFYVNEFFVRRISIIKLCEEIGSFHY
jgi:hypothetical protein